MGIKAAGPCVGARGDEAAVSRMKLSDYKVPPHSVSARLYVVDHAGCVSRLARRLRLYIILTKLYNKIYVALTIFRPEPPS